MLKEPGDAPFKLPRNALADPIPPGGSATFTVAFEPTKDGQIDNEVQVWLQGEPAPELVIPVTAKGQLSGGCSCGSADGSSQVLALLALVGVSAWRRRRTPAA